LLTGQDLCQDWGSHPGRVKTAPVYESCGVWGSLFACDRPFKALDYGICGGSFIMTGL
jgi:hypothetical protein